MFGYLWCFTLLLIRGPSGRKRFNLLGTINAVTPELTITNNEATICELFGKLLVRYRAAADDAGAGQRPLSTLLADADPGG